MVADTVNPFLGADLLHVEGPIHQIPIWCMGPSDSLPEIVRPLFQDQPTILTSIMKEPSPALSKVRHSIDAGDSSPTYAKVRQMSEEKLKAKEEFTTLLQTGIVTQ